MFVICSLLSLQNLTFTPTVNPEHYSESIYSFIMSEKVHGVNFASRRLVAIAHSAAAGLVWVLEYTFRCSLHTSNGYFYPVCVFTINIEQSLDRSFFLIQALLLTRTWNMLSSCLVAKFWRKRILGPVEPARTQSFAQQFPILDFIPMP